MTPARLAVAALVLGPLAYLWVPLGDGPIVLGVVAAAEIGALVAGTAAIVTGLRARRRRPVVAGAAALALVLVPNALLAL